MIPEIMWIWIGVVSLWVVLSIARRISEVVPIYGTVWRQG